MTTSTLPTFYIPHGGGPCFFMDPLPGLPSGLWDPMARHLRSLPHAVGRRPRAVLVISAHWECPRITVQSAATHTLLFDYYGFPDHTYRLRYPAAGEPQVARRVRALLTQQGIACDEEQERGLDHGVFVPFKLIYPEADVPVVQLSLRTGLDPLEHLRVGRALQPLRHAGVLIVGSGMSFHNLRHFMTIEASLVQGSDRFDAWLNAAVSASPADRERSLATWSQAPGALVSHPRSEHLLPLMVAAGAAGDDAGHRIHHERLLGKLISGFQFGATPAALPA